MDDEEKEVEGHAEKPEVELSGFSKVSHEHPPSTTLYLFGRTGREKEEWFHHFLFASVDAQKDKERDKQRPGRCVSRSGMRHINALVRRRHLYKCYVYVDYGLHAPVHAFHSLLVKTQIV